MQPSVKILTVTGEEVLLTGAEAQAVLDDQAAIAAELLATRPPRVATKNALYARMTDPEMDALDGFLQQQATSRQRREWVDATMIEIDRADVRAMAAQLFGAERAAEILDGAS